MDVIIVLLTAFIIAGGGIYVLGYGVWIFIISPLLGEKNKYKYDEAFDPIIAKKLSASFKYYQHLHSNSKNLFVSRVREFMTSKEFIGREELVVTEEMKILISAAAIQVTFGLSKFGFDHFEKIYIYPKQFYSRINKNYHVGEVNLAGAIVFSWEDFKEGFEDETDNYNVGLHEMAHALRFDKFKSDEFDEFFAHYFEKFLAVGMDEFMRAKEGKNAFLRKYAGTNHEEFFSVCIEYFFESSLEMKQKLPELYRHMCILLNQDPSLTLQTYTSVRESLFVRKKEQIGELFFTSSLSYTALIIPYLLGFIVVFSKFKISFNNLLNSVTIFSGIFIALYVAAGGFFISRRFKRFKIYKNALVVTYPLNPVLKNEVIEYDHIISAALSTSESNYSRMNSSADYLVITYTDGIEILSEAFSINGIDPANMEKAAAFLKRKNVLIKIFSTKWDYKAIVEMENNLPLSFVNA